MELLDTYYVQFGGVLAVSGHKTLAVSNQYIYVAKSQLHLDYFQNTQK